MDTLTPTQQTPLGSALLLIRGLPGSGKSYLAAALQQRLGASNVVMLDPDATDYTSSAYTELSAALTQQGVDTKFHPYRFLRRQAHEGIEAGKTIIWNQAFTNLDGFNKTVINLQNHAQEHGVTLPVLVVEVEASHQTVEQRVAKRAQTGGHNVSAAEFARFYADYHSFAAQYPAVLVNGEGDVQLAVTEIMTALHHL